jgi:hypothetical protein
MRVLENNLEIPDKIGKFLGLAQRLKKTLSLTVIPADC